MTFCPTCYISTMTYVNGFSMRIALLEVLIRRLEPSTTGTRLQLTEECASSDGWPGARMDASPRARHQQPCPLAAPLGILTTVTSPGARIHARPRPPAVSRS